MNKKLLAGLFIGGALAISAAIITFPAILINSSIPSVSLAQEKRVKGDVSYQPIALPPHVALIVQLVDVTKGDGPAKIIAETILEPGNQIPVTFSLPVEDENIKQDHHYALQARIMAENTLLFASSRLPVSNYKEDVYHHITLKPVRQDHAVIIRRPDLKGQKWLVEDIFNGGVIDNSHITLLIDTAADASDIKSGLKFHISGSGGCNQYTSMATIDEQHQQIRFSPPAITFKACSEAISMQENRFIDMLTKTRRYILDDVGRLFFQDEQNKDIGRLVPTE